MAWCLCAHNADCACNPDPRAPGTCTCLLFCLGDLWDSSLALPIDCYPGTKIPNALILSF